MLNLRRRLIAVICPALLWLISAGIEAHASEYGPESVVVIANRAAPESLKIARYYMKMRDIPEKQLILVDAPTTEHISRQEYLDMLHNPILAELLDRQLVDAFAGPVDNLGRKTASIFKNRIRYLVLCMGIPSKVREADDTEDEKDYLERYFTLSQPSMIKQFSSGRLSKNEASVDSELALLLERGTPLRGFIPNPLYAKANRDALTDILRVTRLDGPSAKAVIGMLKSSWNGEQNGLRGRAYVDEDGRGGNYRVGNIWMANTANLFRRLGFGISHDTASSTFSPNDRFDAPVLYAGWYAATCNGPFTLPGFRFPDGAIAAHLHSFSASSMRSTNKGWVGPFVERGVACTFGNVSEPYLNLTHKFDAFFEALSNGWNFADAAYFALPGLSWQGVAVGDPLYRPFARSIEEQLEAAGDKRQILKDQYLFIRKANLMVAADQKPQAIELLEKQFLNAPGPALALDLARLYAGNDEVEKACSSLAYIKRLKPRDSDLWGLLAEIADELAAWGDPGSAVEIYANLLSRNLPDSTSLAFTQRGINLAEQAGKPKLASRWRAKLN